MYKEEPSLTVEELANQFNASVAISSTGADVLGSSVSLQTEAPICGVSVSVPSLQKHDNQAFLISPDKSSSCDSTNTHSTLPSSEDLGLDFPTPIELLILLDDNIFKGAKEGGIDLHLWQTKFMMDFANAQHTKESPFRAAVQACNGSGKDKYIIAACAVWICMRYKSVECPITSSSGAQLDNQTCAHIERLCNKCNAIIGPLWKLNYRYYEFKHIGDYGEPNPSTIKCFATDEAGKVEGYHPTESGKKMAIFTSETKSIPEDITSALTRCVGYTHRVDASSPGLQSGYYYNTCSSAIPRSEIDNIKSLSSVETVVYKVTAYDCPHITEAEIEAFAASLPGGKNNPVFRSGMLAEFGSTDEMVVIPSSIVWKAVHNLPHRKEVFNIPWIKEDYNTGGLDLSDGGAETVLAIRNGNKLIALECFKFEDSEDSINYLEELFKKHKLNHPKSIINGDYCGMGGPMLRALKRRGWSNMRYIDSRNTAAEPKTYANRGTELFFNLRKLLEQKDVILFYDKLLIEQLCTRFYKMSTKLIHCLLTKLEQRSKGYPSPDRADGVNLCFWGYKSSKVPDEVESPLIEEEKKEPEKIIPDFDLNSWAYSNQRPKIEHLDNDDICDEIKMYNKQLIKR